MQFLHTGDIKNRDEGRGRRSRKYGYRRYLCEAVERCLNSSSQKSANHFRLPALTLILCRNTHARQKVTNPSVGKPITRHLSYRLNDTLFAKMGHQQAVRPSVAVGNLGGSQAGLSLLLQWDAKLDQSVSDSGSRGKSFDGNLGNGAAIFDVFFFEESS